MRGRQSVRRTEAGTGPTLACWVVGVPGTRDRPNAGSTGALMPREDLVLVGVDFCPIGEGPVQPGLIALDRRLFGDDRLLVSKAGLAMMVARSLNAVRSISEQNRVDRLSRSS